MPLPNKLKPLTPTGKTAPGLVEELMKQASARGAYDPTALYLGSYAANFNSAPVVAQGAMNFGKQAGDILSKAAYEDEIAPLSDWMKLLGIASSTGGWGNAVKKKAGTAITDFLTKRIK